ncbi:MAG: DNA primase [Acidimicrobiia bacterium]|nr:DNA primase [Acidimicrobiia bacterium]MYC57408.1 DNA primase [Acidimicrobiia bacterium]MYG94605.1 DNA primase [Acidimicrobiia bacterium]MYI30246.1 DNA primase [Acidimicrobiia bacterium]
MGIHNEDVARVREETDVVALIGEHVQLKRVGRRWQGICPFHTEKTPSFSVNAEMGVYHCFGCKASGDAITFLREIEQLAFTEAVERLASKAGISLRYTTPGEGEGHARRGKLSDALEQAVQWYHQRLLTAPDAGRARGYLRQRGYDGDIARRYKLGWAPDEWDELARALGVGTKGGMAEEVFFDAGLGFRNAARRLQDSFRARLLFPIFDASNKPVGFGGRVLPEGEGPKYKNSVDNAVYRKSRVLYGLNWAKQEIVNSGEAIVCEGYTDVIGFGQVGISRAVATCGTALTEDHVRVLRRYAPRIVLAFDADSAGQTAAERFSQWEHVFDLEVVVADLPVGSDPGDLARSNPQRLVAAVADAEDFLDFRINRVLGEADLSSLKGQVRAAEQAVRLVAEHPNAEVRDKYLMQIADRCSVNPNHLRQEATKTRSSGSRHLRDQSIRDAGNDGDASAGLPSDSVERQVLWLMVHLREVVWPEIVPERFHHFLCREAFEVLLEYPDIDVLLVESELAKGGSRLLEFIRELQVLQDEELLSSKAHQDKALALLVHEAAQRQLRYLEGQVRVKPADNVLMSEVADLKRAIDYLRESEWHPNKARELLRQMQQEA